MKNMKSIKLAGLLCLFFSGISFAQVTEEESTKSDGKHNAFVIDLNADSKMSENVWKSYIGKIGKTKRDRKSKEWRSESIVIPAVASGYNVNLTGKFEDLKGSSRVYVWLRMDGKYINSEDYTNEARGVKSFLEEYAIEVEKAVVQKEVEEEEKMLKGFEKDLEKLIKKKEGYHKDIKKAEETILKAEKNIEENIIDQEDAKIQIEEQKAILAKVRQKLREVGKDQ